MLVLATRERARLLGRINCDIVNSCDVREMWDFPGSFTGAAHLIKLSRRAYSLCTVKQSSPSTASRLAEKLRELAPLCESAAAPHPMGFLIEAMGWSPTERAEHKGSSASSGEIFLRSLALQMPWWDQRNRRSGDIILTLPSAHRISTMMPEFACNPERLTHSAHLAAKCIVSDKAGHDRTREGIAPSHGTICTEKCLFFQDICL